MANLARFLINSSPSTDGGYDVNPGDPLQFRVESPSLVRRVTFEVHSSDPNSPRATNGSPSLTLNNGSGSSGPAVDAAKPSSIVTVTSGIPADRTPHLWEVRCTVNGGRNQDGTLNSDYVFSRFVAMRAQNGGRLILPGESYEYDPVESWTEAFNDFVRGESGLLLTLTGDLGGTLGNPIVERIHGATAPESPAAGDTGKVLQVSGAGTLTYGQVQTNGIADGAVTNSKLADGVRITDGYAAVELTAAGKTWTFEGVADVVGKTAVKATIGGGVGVLRLLATGAKAGDDLDVDVTFAAGDIVRVFNGSDTTPLVEESAAVACVRNYPFRYNGTAWSPWREATDPHEVVQGAAGGRRIDSYQTVALNNTTATWDITGKASTPADISGVSVLDVAVNGSSCQLDMRASELGPIKVGDLAVLHATFATQDSALSLITGTTGETPDSYILSPAVLGQKKTIPIRRTGDKLESWYPSTDPGEVITFAALGRTIPTQANVTLTATETVVYLNTTASGSNHATLQFLNIATGTTGKLRLADGLYGDTVHASVSIGAGSTLLVYRDSETDPFYTYTSPSAANFDLDFERSTSFLWRARSAPLATTNNAGLMTAAQVVKLNAAVLSKAYGRLDTDVALPNDTEKTLIDTITVTGLTASSTYAFVVGVRICVHKTSSVSTCGFIDIVAYGSLTSDASGVATSINILGSVPDQSKLPSSIATMTARVTDPGSLNYFYITATRPTGVAMIVDSVEYHISSLERLTA